MFYFLSSPQVSSRCRNARRWDACRDLVRITQKCDNRSCCCALATMRRCSLIFDSAEEVSLSLFECQYSEFHSLSGWYYTAERCVERGREKGLPSSEHRIFSRTECIESFCQFRGKKNIGVFGEIFQTVTSAAEFIRLLLRARAIPCAHN